MISQDSQQFESFIPVYDAIPEKWEDARAFVVEELKKISDAVNIREIGWFLDEELLSGKQFIPGVTIRDDGGDSQQFRAIFRKVIDFGPLSNVGLNTQPHGILIDNNFTLIQLWASATDPIALTSFSIPFATASTIGQVEIFLDATNINIITDGSRTTYTRVFVFIEYLQEL